MLLSTIKRRAVSCKNLPDIYKDYKAYIQQETPNHPFKEKKMFIVAWEKNTQSADLNAFYFYQDLHVAQLIHKNNPKKHVDIWSRIDGFVAHVASYREIELFDIRPMSSPIHNVIFTQADLMRLDESMYNYADSVSSLSVLEHFGLWRYGDTIDIDWYIKWLDSIYNILQPWGKAYISLPIWPQRVEFNAHRVFSVQYFLSLFENKYKIDSFSYVDDNGVFHANVALEKDLIDKNYNCVFGNGIIEITKL